MKTQIKKSTTHDRMSIRGKFPSGASMNFSATRNGDSLTLGFSNDINELKRQSKIVSKWCDHRKNETNQARFDRIENAMQSCKSGAEFMNFISKN